MLDVEEMDVDDYIKIEVEDMDFGNMIEGIVFIVGDDDSEDE